MGATVRGALARLQLDLPQEGPRLRSVPFFRNQRAPADFFLFLLRRIILRNCTHAGGTRRLFSHSNADSRALAAMQDAAKYGLGRMPAVETSHCIADSGPPRRHSDRMPGVPRPQCRGHR